MYLVVGLQICWCPWQPRCLRSPSASSSWTAWPPTCVWTSLAEVRLDQAQGGTTWVERLLPDECKGTGNGLIIMASMVSSLHSGLASRVVTYYQAPALRGSPQIN